MRHFWSDADLLAPESWDRFRDWVYAATKEDVERALAMEQLGPMELAALLSPAAESALGAIAERARAVTTRRFGRTIVLYVPLYLSNECTNQCTYCGFAIDRPLHRHTLTLDEMRAEVDQLKELQFDHVLLLTGEAKRVTPVPYIGEAVAYCHERFSSVGIEVFPMMTEQYAELADAGCDALTLYQETYSQPTYAKVHPKGPKARFDRRIAAPGYAAAAGMRSVGLGALLGLADWRVEGMFMGLHGRVIKRAHWRTRLSIGFPKLRDDPGGGVTLFPMSERDLTQLICSLRIFFPDADLVLSTRERSEYRDGMIGLGVTRMSAGSKTNPGGHALDLDAGEQFGITDQRSPDEIVAAIEKKGYEPVWKDWDRQFLR